MVYQNFHNTKLPSYSSGTFHFKCSPISYNSAKDSPTLFVCSSSLYFLYNCNAALASSIESCVSDWILIPKKTHNLCHNRRILFNGKLPKKCQAKNRRDTIRWCFKWNSWTVSTTWSVGTTKFITLERKKYI